VLLSLVLLSAPAGEPKDAQAWHRLVSLLQYLEGDYAKAVSTQDADELAEQRGLADEATSAIAALGEPAAGYRAEMVSVKQRIAAAKDPGGVTSDCGKLAWRILEEQQLQRAPKSAPDLAQAKTLWASNCAVCHGVNGDAQTPVAATLTPKPFNFHDPERMAALTPYRAFNTVAFGVKGTAMVPFTQLSEADRWSLAFYVFTFRHPECDHAPPAVSLEQLASSNDTDLGLKLGVAEVPCLRHRFTAMPVAMFDVARKGLTAARALEKEGKKAEARSAVVDAYLAGIEPIEPTLRARNPALVKRLEQGFTRARIAADTGQRFSEEADALFVLFDEGERDATPSDFWTVFFAALLILLREGFEALVVVGALLAVLKKMQAGAQARVVYLAVVAALISGMLALVFAQRLLAGANREWMETLVAFFAVAMLLYAALWMNQRSNMSAFMTELRGQMQTAIGAGSSLGLFTVAYTAVARESFETALFIEGLAGDSPRGALWGAAAGLAGLCVMVMVIRRVGFVMPMKTLFSASTALLLATAVMVLGKGLHGLQEVGVLGLRPVPFVELDALGIFPDAITLGPQLVLAVAAFWWWRRSTARPRKPAPA
jgi:high-affinity iron transporter